MQSEDIDWLQSECQRPDIVPRQLFRLGRQLEQFAPRMTETQFRTQVMLRELFQRKRRERLIA